MPGKEGGCLCGRIRYRVTGTPLFSVTCHCRSCRKASGAPSVAWLTFGRDEYHLMQGNPTAFASSPGVVRSFCGACGSPITFEPLKDASTIDVTTASLDDPTAFAPTSEVWLEHRIPWQPLDATLPHFQRGNGS